MLYRMARQALAGNPLWADTVHLLDQPLIQVTVQGELCLLPDKHKHGQCYTAWPSKRWPAICCGLTQSTCWTSL